MREATYDFGAGYKRWKKAGGKMDSSFDEGYDRCKKSQGKGGDTAGSNATDHLRATNCDFMGSYENWKKARDSSFDEGNAKWNSPHRQDDPDRGIKSNSTRKSESEERKHRRYDRDCGSDYEGDATMGPQYPSKPRGARNADYEDARRDYEKRWEDQSPSKKRDETHFFHMAMEYAWIMRTGNDRKER